MPTALLQARIGSVTVLARPEGRRLWLLDESAAVLWDCRQAGVDEALVVGTLAQRFGLATEAATDYLRRLEMNWRDAGMIGTASSQNPIGDDPFEPLSIFPPPSGKTPAGSVGYRLTIAQQPIVLEVRDADLRGSLDPLIAPMRDCRPPSADTTADLVTLSGDAASWRLTVNDADMDSGRGLDAAVVATVSVLTELGSRTRERLLVVHGAGLISPDGRCLLLVAPGGSGKSTLAVALAAQGFRILSDDVVPVRSDGAALGLGLPACIKRGSWEVLAAIRPDLRDGLEILRFGQTVRLLSTGSGAMTDPVAPSFLLFPEYRPGAAPTFVPLAPEQALQRLVEADAIIRDLTQEKLESLCRWVRDIPAYSLTFHDLGAGTALVREIVGDSLPEAV